MSTELPEIVPIFPLPNIVLFAGSVLPLHIFEPRYRELAADALEGDRIIVPVLLKPDWDLEDTDTPPVFPVATAGRIVTSQKMPDGRYFVTLQGTVRLRILEEIPGKSYRRARVAVMPEDRAWIDTEDSGPEMVQLLARFHALHGNVQISTSGFDPATHSAAREITLNTIATHIETDPVTRQGLLEENDLGERARRVGEILARSLKEKDILRRHGGNRPDDPTMN